MAVDGDVTIYNAGLACVPSRQHDPCESVVAFDYVADRNALADGVAILISEFSGDLSLSVNGQILAATHNKSRLLRLLPQQPVLVDVADFLIKNGANRIELRVRSGSILGGFLSKVVIGKRDAVAVRYDRAVLFLATMPTLFGGALLLIAAITSYLAIRHRDRKFLLGAITSLSFGTSILCDITTFDLHPSLLVGIRLLRMVAGSYTMAFVFSVSDRPYPLSLRALAALPAAFFMIFMLSTDRYEAGIVTIVFWVLLILLMLHGILLLFLQQIKSPNKPSPVLLVLGSFGVLSASVNFAQSMGFAFEFSNVMRGFGPIIFVMALGFYLIIDISNKTLRIEQANEIMADEIQRVTKKLTAIHEDSEQRRRSLVIQNERQRLMGDLHDGLAGNLISIQALTSEIDEVSVGQINKLARQALLDLRLVVESLDSFNGDLAAVLAAFRERIMPQYQKSVTQIEWDISSAPALLHLTPEISLGIFRILQEAITNSVRHGAARKIRITARSLRGDPMQVLIFVTDNGGAVQPVIPGFGMRNMMRRASIIGATVQFRFSTKGTTVLLYLGRSEQNGRG